MIGRLVSVGALFLPMALGETMMEWFLGTEAWPEVSRTRGIALMMDRSRLEALAAEAKTGMVMVVPTDKAWDDAPLALEQLLKEENSKLRADLMFAAGGKIDKVGDFEDLLDFVDRNGGVVDTAFGTPISIDANGAVCLAEYDENWEFKKTDCTQLRLPPLKFEDGTMYLTDRIILPSVLWQELGLEEPEHIVM